MVSLVEALNSDSAGTAYPITELGGRMTTSVLINQSGNLFLYAAYTNTSKSYVAKVKR